MLFRSFPPTTGITLLLLLCIAQSGNARPPPLATNTINAQTLSIHRKISKTKLDGLTFTNQGLIALGVIPSDAKESTGDTIGGIGSAVGIKPGSWKSLEDGTYEGTFVVHPDGFNRKDTDYQSRTHTIDFILNPYYSEDPLSYEEAQDTLQLTYQSTTLEVERLDAKTTGLEPSAFREATSEDPELPIASEDIPRLSLDTEGIVLNPDGSYWTSDEYGPYIYLFSASGKLLQVVQPPNAIIPRDADGEPFFTGEEDPVTGRASGKGFESLTIDRTTGTLYALLQAATIQDGGDDKDTSRYSRLLAWDVSGIAGNNSSIPAPLVGEWVIPLSQTSKGKTVECNEIQFLGSDIFLVLARDSDGRGEDEIVSENKRIDLFSIADATDIHGTEFDEPENPIAEDGELNSDIVPAQYVEFVDYLDEDELERFGMDNSDEDTISHIDAKWESLALAPALDPDFPDDYFLFSLADNDFTGRNIVAGGLKFDQGLDVDNQVLVWRVTLPGVDREGLAKQLGL